MTEAIDEFEFIRLVYSYSVVRSTVGTIDHGPQGYIHMPFSCFYCSL